MGAVEQDMTLNEFAVLQLHVMKLPGDPKKVLPFDKASNNSLLFYYFNVFRF